MTTDASNLALIGIVGTVITALFKLLMANTKALERVAVATETSAREAKERNGHLGNQTIQIAKISKQGLGISKRILERMEKTALIAAEDRDVLTNQNKHIRTEVGKIMDKA